MLNAENLEQVTAKTITEIGNTVLPFGIKLKPTIPSTEKLYQTFPNDMKELFVDILTKKLSNIQEAAQVTTTRVELEIEMLRKASQEFDLYIPETFYKILNEHDVIEIYDVTTKNQLYRNLEFLDRSSYDLLTMLSHPYTDLFERSGDLGDRLTERSEWVTANESGPVSWDLPDHHLIEKKSPQKWKYLMKMGYVCPVFSTAPETEGQRIAWASTLQVQRVGFGAG